MDSMVPLRPGAVDKGRIYEQKMAALLATKLSLDQNVEDFWMLSNIGGIGDFDDLVISVLSRSGSKCLYFIQFKHIEKETLQVQLLESETSEFGLKKYQETFEILQGQIGKGMFLDYSMDNVFLILHTNAKLLGRSHKVKISSEPGHGLVNTSSQLHTICRISNLDEEHISFDEKFLSRFLLYTKQANATRLDELIKSLIFNHFNDVQNTSVFSLTHFFTVWSIGRKSKIKTLQKDYLQMNLLELILLPYIIDPRIEKEVDYSNIDLIKRTILTFNIVPILEKQSLHNIFPTVVAVIEDIFGIKIDLSNSWNAHLSQEQLNTIFKKRERSKKDRLSNILRERSQYTPHLTFRDLYLTAWQCRLVPLVLSCTSAQETIQNALRVFDKVAPNLSFVLVCPNFKIEGQNFSVFQRLMDIKDFNLVNEHLSKVKISLQSKSAAFLNDFDNNLKIIREITPDVLMTLLNGPFQLGIGVDVADYYVPRKIRLPILSIDILDMQAASPDKECLFIITDADTIGLLKYSEVSMCLGAFLQNKDANVSILIPDETDVKELRRLVDSIRASCNKSVHLLRMIDEKYLEWIYSAGPVNVLLKFVAESVNSLSEIPEDQIDNIIESKVNLLSSNPGMGKTMLMKSIAMKYKPTTWVKYIYLREHISDISKIKNMGEFIEYHFNSDASDKDQYLRKFCEAIYMTCIENKQMVWLFDGYDEVAANELIVFLKGLLSSNLAKIWITTRATLKSYLEDSLQILSLEVLNFTEEDRGVFLRKYFAFKRHIFNFSVDQVEYIVTSIDSYLRKISDIFMNVPLYIKMLAEVFADDVDKINEKENMSLVQLYDIYINIELGQYKSYQASTLRQIISKLALKLFYFPEQLEGIIDYKELLGNIPVFKKDDRIVTNVDENGDVIFAHQSFAEFLVADLISSKVEHGDDFEKIKYSELMQTIETDEKWPLRVFLDKLARQISPVSKADLKKAEHTFREKRDDVLEELKWVETDARASRDQVVEAGKKVEKHFRKIKKLFK